MRCRCYRFALLGGAAMLAAFATTAHAMDFVSNPIVLSKSVCNASTEHCNVTTGSGFGANKRGLPGDELIYRLEFSASSGNFFNLKVFDSVPEYTKLKPFSVEVVAQPQGISCNVTNPLDQSLENFTGTIHWACSGLTPDSRSGVVAYSVFID